MIDMRMGQQYIINLVDRDRNILIYIDISALLQAAVNQNAFIAGFYIVTTAGHFVVGAYKAKFHEKTPFIIKFKNFLSIINIITIYK